MQIREHPCIRAKHLRQPYYYRRWFRCRRQDCPTTLVMPEEFKVFPTLVAEEEVPTAPDLVMLVLDQEEGR